MPGQFTMSIDKAVETARETEKLGVGGLLLFGLPQEKDEVGSDAYSESGIIQETLNLSQLDA